MTTLTALHFLIAALTTWRLASLLANEPGAFGCFERFRDLCLKLDMTTHFWRAFRLHDGITCEWCNSVWIAAALVFWLGWHPLVIPALSAAAILTKYLLHVLQQADKYLDQVNKRLELETEEGYQPVNVPEHSFLMKEMNR